MAPDPDTGFGTSSNVVQYEDALKIGFLLWPAEMLERIASMPSLPAELDAGYRALLDKDGLTTGQHGMSLPVWGMTTRRSSTIASLTTPDACDQSSGRPFTQ